MTKKIKNILSTIIILGIFGGILYKTSNLRYIQIGILLLLCRVVFKSTTQKRLIKYGGTSIGIVGIVFLLGLGYLPLFEIDPNNQDFISTQSRNIIVKSLYETSIISVKEGEFIKKQEIVNTEKKINLKESKINTITFTNKNTESKSTMLIQYPDQTTIIIYPNSSFSLEKTGNKEILKKIYGKMEYIPGKGDQVIVNNIEPKEITDFNAKGLWDEYTKKQRIYILEKAGGNLMENESIRKISHTMILLGSKIRPTQYLPYLENEKKYQKILGWTDKKREIYKDKSLESSQNMIEQAKEGIYKTKFLQFLNK